MGLDMYAYAVDESIVGDAQVDLNIESKIAEHLGIRGWDSTDEKKKAAAVKKLLEVTMKQDIKKDLYQWRKFNALHRWMKELYDKKGGKNKDFNCDTVRLDWEDLDNLEIDAGAHLLKPMSGFFFGLEEIDKYHMETVPKFIALARYAIEDGSVVFYDSWW